MRNPVTAIMLALIGLGLVVLGLWSARFWWQAKSQMEDMAQQSGAVDVTTLDTNYPEMTRAMDLIGYGWVFGRGPAPARAAGGSVNPPLLANEIWWRLMIAFGVSLLVAAAGAGLIGYVIVGHINRERESEQSG